MDTVLLELQEIVNQMRSELMSLEIHRQQVQKRVKKFHHLQAEDDETCMQLQTYTIQFSGHKEVGGTTIPVTTFNGSV
ncbi:hypothetical protein Vadar_005836 [Vaccinium darrowii]|uniref:Uncharacterized protein n=1 Tax=Vaccinium darrowii TaxID=229202 RepID=A0ACB7XNU7_9ERIC|nr:hypothetical protein Vadar_005836 [Vaccinium darrowii]